MKIDVKQTVNDLDGNAIPMNATTPDDGKKLTIADVFINALITPPPPPNQLSAQQSVRFYDLALTCNKARKEEGEGGGGVEIDSELAADLKVAINRMYGPIVTGQVLHLLDGK